MVKKTKKTIEDDQEVVDNTAELATETGIVDNSTGLQLADEEEGETTFVEDNTPIFSEEEVNEIEKEINIEEQTSTDTLLVDDIPPPPNDFAVNACNEHPDGCPENSHDNIFLSEDGEMRNLDEEDETIFDDLVNHLNLANSKVDDLLEWVEEHEDFHAENGDNLGARFPKSGLGKDHVVQEGETLAIIAKERYGQSGRQRDIAVLNPKVKSNDDLKKGWILRMPSIT